MPTRLFLDTNSNFNSGSQFELVQNPQQPRGMRANRPAKEFTTLTGVGGIQAQKEWFPTILLSWPALVKSNADHAELLAAFQTRLYVATGVNHFIGILPAASKGSGFPFWNAAKFIEIRIIEIMSAANPLDNDLDEVLFDMIVRAIWIDPD